MNGPFRFSDVARSVPFDNSTNGFVSDNVQDAIEEINAATSADSNFSFHLVPSGSTITIPVNQQMILVDDLTIEGELIVDGVLVMDEFSSQEDFLPPYLIYSGETYKVSAGKQFFSAVPLLLEGELQVDGLLVMGA